jgi:phage shock protein A
MSKEFEYWKKESASCSAKLDEQIRLTEDVVTPLQDQLADLEEKIREAHAKIGSTKTQVMRNDITISNLLYSVITTR